MGNNESEYNFLSSNKCCFNEYCLVPLREEDMELTLSNFLVKSDVNMSKELSDEETRSVEQELKKLGYF